MPLDLLFLLPTTSGIFVKAIHLCGPARAQTNRTTCPVSSLYSGHVTPSTYPNSNSAEDRRWKKAQANLLTPHTLSGLFPKTASQKVTFEVCLSGPGDQGHLGNLSLPLMTGIPLSQIDLQKKKKSSFSLFSYYVLNQEKNSIPVKQQGSE